MSDTQQQNTSTQGGNNNSGEQTPAAGDEFQAITSQDELNRVLDDRLKRERAKFSDYKDLKSKAARLDELEQANQSELERANGRVTEAEKQANDARAESLRLRTAIQHDITLEDADLFLTGTDEETLTAQAKRLSERADQRKKQGNYVAREGNHSQPQADSVRDFTRGLFGSGE